MLQLLFMDYYQFVFPDCSTGQHDMLIALLSEAGFNGFEENVRGMNAFVAMDCFDEEAFKKILQTTRATSTKSVIKEINWNEKWEKEFSPVLIPHPDSKGLFAVIRAGFHEALKDSVYDLIVNPKMSFGTGHHATTYMVIQQMASLNFAGKDVIDFGTGTGVLAILAEKMGAAKIMAIDYDDWSIENAKENIVVNRCSLITVVKADTIAVSEKADIILANINLNIILQHLQVIYKACKPGTSVLFSGFLQQDENQMKNTLIKTGFSVINVIAKDNWLTIVTEAI